MRPAVNLQACAHQRNKNHELCQTFGSVWVCTWRWVQLQIRRGVDQATNRQTDDRKRERKSAESQRQPRHQCDEKPSAGKRHCIGVWFPAVNHQGLDLSRRCTECGCIGPNPADRQTVTWGQHQDVASTTNPIVLDRLELQLRCRSGPRLRGY